MKTITVRGNTGSWNEKIYKGNTIYLNGSPVILTEAELKSLIPESSEAATIAESLATVRDLLGRIEIKGYKKIKGSSVEVERIYDIIKLLGLDVKDIKNSFFYDDYERDER